MTGVSNKFGFFSDRAAKAFTVKEDFGGCVKKIMEDVESFLKSSDATNYKQLFVDLFELNEDMVNTVGERIRKQPGEQVVVGFDALAENLIPELAEKNERFLANASRIFGGLIEQGIRCPLPEAEYTELVNEVGKKSQKSADDVSMFYSVESSVYTLYTFVEGAKLTASVIDQQNKLEEIKATIYLYRTGLEKELNGMERNERILAEAWIKKLSGAWQRADVIMKGGEEIKDISKKNDHLSKEIPVFVGSLKQELKKAKNESYPWYKRLMDLISSICDKLEALIHRSVNAKSERKLSTKEVMRGLQEVSMRVENSHQMMRPC